MVVCPDPMDMQLPEAEPNQGAGYVGAKPSIPSVPTEHVPNVSVTWLTGCHSDAAHPDRRADDGSTEGGTGERRSQSGANWLPQLHWGELPTAWFLGSWLLGAVPPKTI